MRRVGKNYNYMFLMRTHRHTEKRMGGNLEAMGTLMALIVVMLSPVHTDLQTH